MPQKTDSTPAITSSLATTPVLSYDGLSDGAINIPAAAGFTSLTYYGCETPDGTFVPLHSSTGVPVAHAVQDGRGYLLPEAVRGWRFLKLLGFNPMSLLPALYLRPGVGMLQTSGGAAAVADADPVGVWEDQSGNSRHAVQTTAGKRPTLRLAVKNGKPVVRFDGTDDVLACDSMAALLTGSDMPFTVFGSLVLSNLVAAQQAWVSASNSATTVQRHYVGTFGQTTRIAFRRDDANSNKSASSATADTAWHVWSYVFSGIAGQLFIDGTQVGATANQDVGVLTLDRFSIGSMRTTSDLFPLTGDIGPILVLPFAATDAQRVQVENDMRAEYATP